MDRLGLSSLSLVAAASLLFLIGLLHSVLGERYILIRLFRRDDLPKLYGGTEFTKQVLRMAWHVTTLAWWGIAMVLAFLSTGGATPRTVALVIAGTFLCSAVGSLVMARGRHFSWLVFGVIGALCLLAAG